jgi:hypothetical protein
MRSLLSLAWLVACTGSTPTDTDTGTADTGTAETGTPGTPVAWAAQRACGSIRMFAASGDRGLGLELDADVLQAVLDQVELELDADFAAGTAHGIVQDGIDEDAVCSSIEEFPPYAGPYWKITGGTVHLEFTPASGLGADDTDWSYDGTEVGTVRGELRDLELTPMQGAPAAEIPDLDLDLPLSVIDLPA